MMIHWSYLIIALTVGIVAGFCAGVDFGKLDK